MAALFLSGSLSHFNAGHLLRLLQAARVTGCLKFERAREKINLYVEDGRTLFATSTGGTLRVGDVLVRRGEVRPEAIEFVLAIQQDRPGLRIGHMLVESGALTEDQIREAVLAVQRHIVLGLLLWQEGKFAFRPDERVEDEEIRLDLDVDKLLASALSYAVEMREITSRREAA